MDPRVITLRDADTGETIVFGKRFRDPIAAEQFAEQVIARREKLAGRQLSAKELREGLPKIEDRPAHERVTALKQPEPSDANPFTDEVIKNGGYQSKKETRKELYARAAREWDERHRAPEDDPDADRKQKALEVAQVYLERMLFSADMKQSDVARAESLIELAKSNPDEFKTRYNEIVATEKQTAEAKRQALRQQMDSIDSPEEFEAEQPKQANVWYPPENKSPAAEAWRASQHAE